MQGESNHEMTNRGVTRPEMGKHQHGKDQDREFLLKMHHKKTLWVYWMLILLGCWMVLSPLTFSYSKGLVEPSGGREVWLTMQQRIDFMRWSDVISGFLLVFFGWRSLKPENAISLWVCFGVGVWLTLAPLLFWSPVAIAYLNDTIVGMLVISLSILIPGMPKMILFMKMGSEVPEGWSYNPSSWPQRWIMIATGFLGFVVSRYLAAYQLGYIDEVWDPFFGEGSKRVLDSAMSHSLPISDAGLGTLAYTFEFLMGFMGSPARWRTMPWMVAFFGFLVIPLGLVHIFLVISQPLTVGAWCTFCLVAAGIMLPMIPLEADEVVAMGQHMVQSVRRGEKFWSVFWKGGQPVVKNKDERTPKLVEMPEKPMDILRASLWGMSVPKALLLCAGVGLLLMLLPSFFDLPVRGGISDLNHLCGAMIVVCSVIPFGEVARSVRFGNLLFGLAVVFVTWFTNGPMILKVVDAIAGIAVIFASLPRGKIVERYGLWQGFIR